MFEGESKIFPRQSKVASGGQGAGDNYPGLRPGDIPAWEQRFEYDEGREVLAPDGNYYRCLIDHTATDDFNTDLLAGNWVIFAGAGLSDTIIGFSFNPVTGDITLTGSTSGPWVVNPTGLDKQLAVNPNTGGNNIVVDNADEIWFGGSAEKIYRDGSGFLRADAGTKGFIVTTVSNIQFLVDSGSSETSNLTSNVRITHAVNGAEAQTQASNGTFAGNLDWTVNLTANRNWSMPDNDGVIALLSDIPTPPTTLYSGDGSIPVASLRTVTIPVNSDLRFSNGTDYQLTLYGGQKFAQFGGGTTPNIGDISLNWGNNNITAIKDGTTVFGRLSWSNVTANRTWEFPDQSGTVALLSDIPSDTNLYNTSGAIPVSTDRKITLPNTSNLEVVAGNLVDTLFKVSGVGAVQMGAFNGTTIGGIQFDWANNKFDAQKNATAFVGSLSWNNITANRGWNLPDASGTIALLSDIPQAGHVIYEAPSGTALTQREKLVFAGAGVTAADVNDLTYGDHTLVTIAGYETGQTYTPTNVTTDRSFDADSTSLDELADVVGTLIADLQSVNVLS